MTLSTFRGRLLNVAIVGALVAGCAGASVARSEEPAPQDAPAGPAAWMALHLNALKVNAAIRGHIAITRVAHRFHNPTARQMEGVFQYFLPPGAAVTALTLDIDGVPVKGEVVERSRARATYEGIVRRSLDPALLEDQGGGHYLAQLFPIPAGGDKEITLTYVEALEPVAGVFEYRCPLDMRATAPISAKQVEIAVALTSPAPLGDLRSPSHQAAVVFAPGDRRHASVVTRLADVTPCRDFRLTWTPVGKPAPLLFATSRERAGAPGYFVATICPDLPDPGEQEGRDIVFVLDHSGSTAGAGVEQSCAALKTCLAALGEKDRFGVAAFSVSATTFAPGMSAASPAARDQAGQFLDALAAVGGTNLGAGLSAACDLIGSNGDRDAVVLLITDGRPNVGDDAGAVRKVLSERLKALPRARLFACGLGPDVDQPFLAALAQEHGGEACFVPDAAGIPGAVSGLLRRATLPALTGLKVEAAGAGVGPLSPSRLPPIHAGGALTVAGGYAGRGPVEIRLTGTVAGKPYARAYRATIPEGASAGGPLASLWAARRIGDLLAARGVDEQGADGIATIVGLAKGHGLPTPFTSLLVTEDMRQKQFPNAPHAPPVVTSPPTFTAPPLATAPPSVAAPQPRATGGGGGGGRGGQFRQWTTKPPVEAAPAPPRTTTPTLTEPPTAAVPPTVTAPPTATAPPATTAPPMAARASEVTGSPTTAAPRPLARPRVTATTGPSGGSTSGQRNQWTPTPPPQPLPAPAVSAPPTATAPPSVTAPPVAGRMQQFVPEASGATPPPPTPMPSTASGQMGVVEGQGAETYQGVTDNPFICPDAPERARSTFSIDVDTASYANTRRFLTQGALPPAAAVRVEEMVNYFTYDYPNPTGDDPFSVNVEVGQCPWSPAHRLARVGLKGREIARDQRPVCNLVFLIDVSGSMLDANKLPLVKAGLSRMARELGENDRVAVVVYAGASGLALPSTSGLAQREIQAAIDRLNAGGSTNGGAGIRLAYRVAREHFVKGGANRVILCTDGDFNVGVTNRADLVRLVEEQAKSGVFLTVLGFGMGNLKDATLEQLADKGNGNYAYIDTLKEAEKVLVTQMSGTLVTIAKDVKVQIEFNPAAVAAYRLIGYENRVLAARDFNDDRKDAGEIGAGHTVTALYEIVPAGAKPALAGGDALKYQAAPALTDEARSGGDLFTLSLRYKAPDGDTSKLITHAVRDGGAGGIAATSRDYRFAAAVALFGMTLRGSPHRAGAGLDLVVELAQEAVGKDQDGFRAEFVDLARRAKALGGR